MTYYVIVSHVADLEMDSPSSCDSNSSPVSSGNPCAQESRRGWKRLRYPEEWAKKKRKHNKDRGGSYTTYKGEQRARSS